MGQILVRAIDGLARAFGRRDLRLLLLGLNDAGKTTILYKLKLGEKVTTIPTIGFNVETIQYRNVNFTVRDVPGPVPGRSNPPLWRHYFQSIQGLVWVVDSNNPERIMESRDVLHGVMAEQELQSQVVLLVMANKSDLPNAMNVADLSDKLQLRNYSNRTWFIQSCCATTGEGLYEGLDWLSTALKNLP